MPTRYGPRRATRARRGAAYAGPETKIPLAWVLYLQEKGSDVEEVLDTLDASELAVGGFFDGSILRAANLFWPLRRPGEALTAIDDAISLGDDDRNHSLHTFRAAMEVVAADDRAIRARL